MYLKGDIVIVPVPFTDNAGFKLRPALVISSDNVHKNKDVMIVQITSQKKNDGLSIELKASDVSIDLPTRSFVRCYKIFVLEDKLIQQKVGVLKKEKYNEIIEIIKKVIE